MLRYALSAPVLKSGTRFVAIATIWFGSILTQATGQQNDAVAGPQPAADQIKIMAVVNGQQITREHLANEAMRRFGESVTEGLVNKHLIITECQKQGIKVTKEDIDQEIDRRARRFRMTYDEYVKLICTERDVTLHKLRNELVWTDIALRRLASSQTQVSDDEIQKRLNSEYGPKVQVRAIAVNSTEEAQQLHAQATANPEQFSRLAINHSVDPNSASVGGLLPPLRQNMGEPDLENAAFGLQVGQISGILQMQNQFVFLKCERHYPATELGEADLAMATQRIREEIRESKLGDATKALSARLQGDSEIVNVINGPATEQADARRDYICEWPSHLHEGRAGRVHDPFWTRCLAE